MLFIMRIYRDWLTYFEHIFVSLYLIYFFFKPKEYLLFHFLFLVDFIYNINIINIYKSYNLFRCDGIAHCPNGEDETIDCYEKKICKKNHFTCTNGECIDIKDRCNGYYDCIDRSDEKNCKRPKCREGNYDDKCPMHFCSSF